MYFVSKGQVSRTLTIEWEMIRRTIALAPSRVSQSQSAGGANEANAPPTYTRPSLKCWGPLRIALTIVWHICLA